MKKMKSKIFAMVSVLFVSLVSLASLAYALPDLQVWSLEYSKETGRLVANIYNQAPEPSDGFVVKFYDNDNYIGEYLYNKTLPRYSIVAVYIKPVLAEGTNVFRAVADADGKIAESLEGNNEKTVSVESEIDRTPTSAFPSVPLTAGEGGEDITVYLIIAVIAVVAAVLIIVMSRRRGLRERMLFRSQAPSPPSLLC